MYYIKNIKPVKFWWRPTVYKLWEDTPYIIITKKCLFDLIEEIKKVKYKIKQDYWLSEIDFNY